MSVVKIFTVVLLCALAAACGRKGPLEAPPNSTAPPPAKEVSPQSPGAKPTTNVPPQETAPGTGTP